MHRVKLAKVSTVASLAHFACKRLQGNKNMKKISQIKMQSTPQPALYNPQARTIKNKAMLSTATACECVQFATKREKMQFNKHI
jgi:hypothetical protein